MSSKMSKALSCLEVGKSLLNKLLNYPAHTSSSQNRGKWVYTEIVSKSSKAQGCLDRKFYDHIFQCQPWMWGVTMARDEQHLLGWRNWVKQDCAVLGVPLHPRVRSFIPSLWIFMAPSAAALEPACLHTLALKPLRISPHRFYSCFKEEMPLQMQVGLY